MWKYAAIVLAAMFVLETLAVAGIFYIGMEDFDKETECANVICLEEDDATSYVYSSGICQCLNPYGEVVLSKKVD